MPVHHVYLSRFSDFFVSGAIPSPVMKFGIVANNLFEFHAFKPGHYISYKFYVDGIGGAKFIVHVSMILVVKLTSVVVLVLLYDCIGILTLVVCVCVHDVFGNHVDLGGLSVCA